MNQSSDFEITVVDMLGKKILDRSFSNLQVSSETLDMSAYSNGVYILQIRSQEKNIVKRIIKN